MRTHVDLPWAPLGLSRDEAARHIGVGVTKFDEMVADGAMPKPKLIGRRRIWNRLSIEAAFCDLPEEGGANEIDALLARSRRSA
ncbi:hypothetical protein ASF65_07885 [Aureimonas sp. Leaf324]|nr:hypothetical protein [Aureimonas sp. Leaf324]KQQ81965.1 hypothetical protein ASF65_07885 [Aureimonas sp. Leaf324]